MINIESKYVTFISDAHFQRRKTPEEKARREVFARFLHTLPDNSTLVLLGDIFDFYFEYASVIPNCYFDVFASLKKTQERGIEGHFVGGNHDSWTGPFMHRELGLIVHNERFLFTSQHRTILCVHGDLDLPGDRAYKLLKSVIRNQFVIKCAKIIHPDLLSLIAEVVSQGSKKIMSKRQEPIAKRLGEEAFSRFFSQGNDIFIMGHVHYPLKKSAEGKDFLIMGDWLEHFSYAVLEGGELSLRRFRE